MRQLQVGQSATMFRFSAYPRSHPSSLLSLVIAESLSLHDLAKNPGIRFGVTKAKVVHQRFQLRLDGFRGFCALVQIIMDR